jgi:hypothetical protein
MVVIDPNSAEFIAAHVLAERLYNLQKGQTDRIERTIDDLVAKQSLMQADVASLKNSWPCASHETKLANLAEDVDSLKTSRTVQNTVFGVITMIYTGLLALFSGWFHRG